MHLSCTTGLQVFCGVSSFRVCSFTGHCLFDKAVCGLLVVGMCSIQIAALLAANSGNWQLAEVDFERRRLPGKLPGSTASCLLVKVRVARH